MRLHVDHVLEGSIRMAGGRLRIDRAIGGNSRGLVVVVGKFESSWENVFSVQDQIPASITDVLRIRLPALARPTCSCMLPRAPKFSRLSPRPPSLESPYPGFPGGQYPMR